MKDAARDSTPTGGSSSKLKISVISEKLEIHSQRREWKKVRDKKF